VSEAGLPTQRTASVVAKIAAVDGAAATQELLLIGLQHSHLSADAELSGKSLTKLKLKIQGLCLLTSRREGTASAPSCTRNQRE
jgi:hypothetical protein